VQALPTLYLVFCQEAPATNKLRLIACQEAYVLRRTKTNGYLLYELYQFWSPPIPYQSYTYIVTLTEATEPTSTNTIGLAIGLPLGLILAVAFLIAVVRAIHVQLSRKKERKKRCPQQSTKLLYPHSCAKDQIPSLQM